MNKENGSMNIAYTERYRSWRAEYDHLFVPENSYPQMNQVSAFADGFSVRTRAYLCQRGRYGSENELVDNQGRVRYTWRNLDIDGDFCTLFRHRNGNRYLIFRTELYGYSVLEVESGRVLHYVPSQVHPVEGQEGEEVFIWTSAEYDSRSDLLAVTGCIWAWPFSTIVLDFSTPLQEQPAERWLDVRKLVDPEYDRYGDLDFVAWKKGELLLRGDDEDGQWEELRLPVEQLWELLKNM